MNIDNTPINLLKYIKKHNLYQYIKAFELYQYLYNNNTQFKNIINIEFKNKKIRFFNEEEFNKIRNQNFIHPTNPNIKEFEDIFILGENIGNCVGISRQLSYSYNNVDLVSGILPILKGTLNAEVLGGHAWIETKDYIIDTSLMLVIDKSIKEEFGYIEENRIATNDLKKDQFYQARKEWTSDIILKTKKK